MSEHTPGPWSCEEGNCVTADFAGTAICILEPVDSFWCGDVCRHPEGEEFTANASLIAAAPDLLRACKQLVAICLPHDVSGRRMLQEAIDAIAKAQGE